MAAFSLSSSNISRGTCARGAASALDSRAPRRGTHLLVHDSSRRRSTRN